MRYTNERIRRICRHAALLTAAGALMCLAAALMITAAFSSGSKAKNKVLPVSDILAMDANHAARPACFEIDREPELVASAEDEDYYMLTGGNVHILSGMTAESYVEVMADYFSGDRTIEGVTKVLIDDRARSDAAAALSDILGKSITDETLAEYVGDVHLRVTEITTWQMVREIYVLYIAFATPLLLFGLAALMGGLAKLSSYKTVSGTQGITPRIVDEQTESADTLWIERFGVYLAPEYIIGITNGVTALRYDEIKRILFTEATGSTRKKQLTAETVNDGTYTLGEALILPCLYEESVTDMDLIFDTCAERSTVMSRVYGELSFRYPFYINVREEDDDSDYRTIDGSGAYSYLADEDREMICDDFRSSGLERYFRDALAVQRMTLEFEPDGYIVVRAPAEREREEELRAELESYITGKLSDGRGGCELWNDEAGEFSVYFRKQR